MIIIHQLEDVHYSSKIQEVQQEKNQLSDALQLEEEDKLLIVFKFIINRL